MSNIWQLQHAKSKFSELVKRTLSDGAQIITRHGRKSVVLLPFEEYNQLSHRSENLADLLLSSPLAGSELSIERNRDLPRQLEMEP